MKFFCAFSLSIASVLGVSAQTTSDASVRRPVEVVVTDTVTAAKPKPKPASTPRPEPTPIIVSSAPKTAGPSVEAPAEPLPVRERTAETASAPAAARVLSFGQIKGLIAEAKRQLQTRPITIASVGALHEGPEMVRIAFHDWRADALDYVVISKEAFLSTKTDTPAISQNGRRLTVRTIRGNGVNTPVVFIDDLGQTHQPVLVQYPIVRGGKYVETAYYMSTHPGLVTPEVVNAGKFYVHNVIEIARQKLAEKGIRIQPKIADIAERLATVEHVDHLRFRTEYHPNIYNDIFTLFALNEGGTYRYSVSSAGAGGMVQMIPSTYRMVRSWHPNVPLKPDFVEGMQDHVNAAQAMLLYMQRTWNDLIANQTIADALASGIASQEHLIAAGYNSNPARLPGYIKRGGANWPNLIPKETQVYLQIWDSLEKHVPMTTRTR